MNDLSIPERFPGGVAFINDVSHPNLIDQDVFIIGKVESYKNNCLYIKTASENSSTNKEILIENFYNTSQNDVSVGCTIGIIGKVLSADTIDFIEIFNEGMEDFQLFDSIPKLMKLYNQKKDQTSLFV